MLKTIVTGGCSFSTVNPWKDTWPSHLSQAYPQYNYQHTGVSSQGNGLISRHIIYHVSELLKTHRPEELLVCVMWSGHDRHDFYMVNDPGFKTNVDNWLDNPIKVTTEPRAGNWVILNWNWKNDYARQYYGTFHDQTGSLIYTIELILRVQWFLKLHNIPYMMSTYTADVLPRDLVTHREDVRHLYEQIDFGHWLDIGGEYDWVKNHSGIPYPADSYDIHPSSDQHKAFTEQIVIPFLQNKNYL